MPAQQQYRRQDIGTILADLDRREEEIPRTVERALQPYEFSRLIVECMKLRAFYRPNTEQRRHIRAREQLYDSAISAIEHELTEEARRAGGGYDPFIVVGGDWSTLAAAIVATPDGPQANAVLLERCLRERSRRGYG